VLVVHEVTTLVEVEVVVVVALVEVVVSVDVPPLPLEVETMVVVPPDPAVGGFNGSRWKTPASGATPVTPFGPAPTAQPS